MVVTQGAASGLHAATKEIFGLRIATSFQLECGIVVERQERLGMGGALNTLANLQQAASINGSCRPWITFAQEKVCQVALPGEGGRIFRSKLASSASTS